MRLVISGYYGYGNTGDEAVLEGMLTSLHKAGHVHTTVLSADPEATRALHGVDAISRTDPRAVWRALDRADLLISGGGGLIQDRTSARSSLYYLGVIEMAYRAGVPVYLYSQGVGPLRRRWLRRMTGVCLRRVRGAGVRDEASGRLLAEIGVAPERIALTADAAFALRPADREESSEALAGIGIEAGKHRLIGVVWRRPIVERPADGEAVDPEAFRLAAGAAVGHFARQHEAKVIVMPFHPTFDRHEAHGFARATSEAGAEALVFDPDGAEQLGHRRLLALVGGMDLLLCVRFHSLVFSALSGTPAVAIAYDPKVRHLAESLGVPWLMPGDDPAVLTSALAKAWEQRTSLSHTLLEKANAFRARAYDEGVRALAMAAGQERSDRA